MRRGGSDLNQYVEGNFAQVLTFTTIVCRRERVSYRECWNLVARFDPCIPPSLDTEYPQGAFYLGQCDIGADYIW